MPSRQSRHYAKKDAFLTPDISGGGCTNASKTLPLRWENFRRKIVTVVHSNGNGSTPFLRSANYRSCIASGTGYYKRGQENIGQKALLFVAQKPFDKARN